MPLNHLTLTIPPSLFPSVLTFYKMTLAPLGYEVVVDFKQQLVGLGCDKKPDFWISKSEDDGTDTTKTTATATARGIHIAFTATAHEIVNLCHEAALKTGAKSNGSPGPRLQYRPTYYAAFMYDPVGNNVEVVCGNN